MADERGKGLVTPIWFTYKVPETKELPMGPVSSNAFSVDMQAQDALNYLEDFHPEAHAAVLAELPEAGCLLFDGSWFDTDAMGVDIEFGSWLVDAIEATGKVIWEEGEPFAVVAQSPEGRMRMIRKVSAFTKE